MTTNDNNSENFEVVFDDLAVAHSQLMAEVSNTNRELEIAKMARELIDVVIPQAGKMFDLDFAMINELGMLCSEVIKENK